VREVAVTTAGRLEGVYREDADRLWRAVLAFAGDPEVASDAVAEAFAQALRRGEAIRDPKRWVWRAAFRIAAGDLAARRRAVDAPAERVLGMEEDVVELIEALRRLPTKQRAALVLHHGAGYPTRDVARIIGSTAAAVRVHLSRGRRRLRELLKEEDDG
jgi:RNA polymerase sigma-70 factor, ECF subfamily